MSSQLSGIKPRKMEQHPFYPTSLQLPKYAHNLHSSSTILGGFAGVCALVTLFTWSVGGTARVPLTCWRRLVFTWCILSGTIHMILEGYYVTHSSQLVGLNTLLAQIWKEYAQCDSRYLVGEKTVWIVEAITSFVWGPLLCYAALRIWLNHTKVQKYMPLLLLISTGQVYGTIVYFYTSLKVGKPDVVHAIEWMSKLGRLGSFLQTLGYDDGNPSPYYFWFYFVFMNSIWILIPGCIIIWALRALGQLPAYRVAAPLAAAKKRQ